MPRKKKQRPSGGPSRAERERQARRAARSENNEAELADLAGGVKADLMAAEESKLAADEPGPEEPITTGRPPGDEAGTGLRIHRPEEPAEDLDALAKVINREHEAGGAATRKGQGLQGADRYNKPS
jgi:hypothetical protein